MEKHGGVVDIQRAAFNQAQITVREAPAGMADRVLARAQGYTQAQDRLFQMDLTRRFGRGRLAEIFGEKAVAMDRQTIGVGLAQSVIEKNAYLIEKHPEAFQFLESYAEGVNEYIDGLARNAPDTLKNYRQITGDSTYVPARWEPADSIAVTQSIAFYLSSNLQEKILLGQVSMALGGLADPTTTKLASALDFRPVYPTFILDADRSQNRWRVARPATPAPIANAIPAFQNPLAGLPPVGCLNLAFPFPECVRKASFGSNNWVVSREFAGGDTAFLANDPHLRLVFPMTFYEGAYDSTPAGGTIRVRGFGLAGVPNILIGHNDHIAWGMTNLGADVDDIYIEVFNREGKKVWHQVDGKETYVALETRQIPLKVRNAFGGVETRLIPLRWVPHHGPVFSEHVPELQSKLDEFARTLPIPISVVASYRWVGHSGGSEFAALLGVGRSKNYAEFRESLQEFRAGTQNIVFAGTADGDIGYYAHGDFPLRPYASEAQAPFAPVIPYLRGMMGRSSVLFRQAAEWAGMRADSPELYRPSSGRIVTANNDPYGHSESRSLTGYQDYFGYTFSTGVRAERITRLLDAAKGNISLATLQAIQTDHVDLLQAAFLEKVRGVRSELKLSERAAAAADALLNWDFAMKASEHTPVIADAWLGELAHAYLETTAAKVPAVLREGLERTAILARTLYHRLGDGLASSDPAVRTQSLELLRAAFEATAKRLDREGLNGVNWGRIHRVKFNNQLAGIMPGFVTMPLERDGSWETVDVAGDSYGPNFRLIVSLKAGQPISAVTSVAGGNYGIFEGEKIQPELLRWRNGEYRELVPFQN